MILLLFIVGVLLIGLGAHIAFRPCSGEPECDVGEMMIAVFSGFLGVVFTLLAALVGAIKFL